MLSKHLGRVQKFESHFLEFTYQDPSFHILCYFSLICMEAVYHYQTEAVWSREDYMFWWIKAKVVKGNSICLDVDRGWAPGRTEAALKGKAISGKSCHQQPETLSRSKKTQTIITSSSWYSILYIMQWETDLELCLMATNALVLCFKMCFIYLRVLGHLSEGLLTTEFFLESKVWRSKSFNIQNLSKSVCSKLFILCHTNSVPYKFIQIHTNVDTNAIQILCHTNSFTADWKRKMSVLMFGGKKTTQHLATEQKPECFQHLMMA